MATHRTTELLRLRHLLRMRRVLVAGTATCAFTPAKWLNIDRCRLAGSGQQGPAMHGFTSPDDTLHRIVQFEWGQIMDITEIEIGYDVGQEVVAWQYIGKPHEFESNNSQGGARRVQKGWRLISVRAHELLCNVELLVSLWVGGVMGGNWFFVREEFCVATYLHK